MNDLNVTEAFRQHREMQRERLWGSFANSFVGDDSFNKAKDDEYESPKEVEKREAKTKERLGGVKGDEKLHKRAHHKDDDDEYEDEKSVKKREAKLKERLGGIKGDEKLHEEAEKKDKVKKGEDDVNPFDSFVEGEMEKSDVMDAISYGGNIKFSKTGKEMIDQIKDVVLPEKQAALAAKKQDADDWLEDTGKAPTHPVEKWWTDGLKIDVPYKYYTWEETRCTQMYDRVVASLSVDHGKTMEGLQVNCPENEEQAVARQRYNDDVRAICECMVDIKACEILMKNLKEGTSYELTPRQIVTLKFD